MTVKNDFWKFASEVLHEAEDVITDLRLATVPTVVTEVYTALDSAQAKVVEYQQKVSSRIN